MVSFTLRCGLYVKLHGIDREFRVEDGMMRVVRNAVQQRSPPSQI